MPFSEEILSAYRALILYLQLDIIQVLLQAGGKDEGRPRPGSRDNARGRHRSRGSKHYQRKSGRGIPWWGIRLGTGSLLIECRADREGQHRRSWPPSRPSDCSARKAFVMIYSWKNWANKATVLEQAKRLDRERAQGHVRSRLHGVPILIK